MPSYAPGGTTGAPEVRPVSYTHLDVYKRQVEDGEYPNDEKALEKIVKGICFDNAKRYFNL